MRSDYPPARLASFIARLPEGVFGINYDLGNSASLGYDCGEELAAYFPHILNVHIKDRVLGGTTVPLGTGNADLPRALGQLSRQGYAGSYILQTARAADGDHAGALARYRDTGTAGWIVAGLKPVNLELAGKTALIAGASRGIGLAIARRCWARKRAANLALSAQGRRRSSGDSRQGFWAIPVSVPCRRGRGRPGGGCRAVVAVMPCNVGSGSRYSWSAMPASGRSVPPGTETEAPEWRRMLDLNLFTALER